MSDFQPFQGAANKTAIFVVGKKKSRVKFPVVYIVWRKKPKASFFQDSTLAEVLDKTFRESISAEPVDQTNPRSPWLTAPKEALEGIKKVIGRSDYQAFAGCCTWLNGVFWIRILKQSVDGNLLIENLHDVGKIKVAHVQTLIEPDLVYPLLRGRDVSSWKAVPSLSILLPNRTDKLAGISESEMKKRWPKTFAYLKRFETQLRKRSGYRQYFKPSDPFYSIYNVGPYSISNLKVVWREQSSRFQAAIVPWSAPKTAIPDHKLMMVPCQSEPESFFLSATLNSSPVRFVVACYVISTSTSTHVLEHIKIPKFSARDPLHVKIAAISKECHEATSDTDLPILSSLQATLDKLVAKLFGLTDAESAGMREDVRLQQQVALDVKED